MGFAQRVNRRVGNLGKLLPKIIVNTARLARQYRHWGVVAHGAHCLLAGLGEHPDDLLALFAGDLEQLLVRPQAVASAGGADGRGEENFHRIVYRPWGSFDSVDEGERYKVKRISVKPGARLSKQMHHHRAEHWVVVAGTAKVTVREDVRLLTENESVYIPLGAVHRLENPGKVELHLIEVQSGAYLGEDDIVRYEDVYARA